MNRGELYLNREDRIQERLCPPIWFEGYSVLRTAFCGVWVASKRLNPYFNQTEIRIDDLYQSLLDDWELHHSPNNDLGIGIPNPPQLYQLEDAIRFLSNQPIIREEVIPSSRNFSDYLTRYENQLMLPHPKDSRKHQGILGKVSHELKRQIINLLS